MARAIIPFGWYGGKASLAKKILPYIDQVKHQTYVEPFGGSAAILLNKLVSPVEVYNDIYGDVVNFFRILRDRGDELVGLLELTPYSREEYVAACLDISEEPLERARQFFVIARQVMMGLATTATLGRWCASAKVSRRGMSMPVSRWLSSINGLGDVANRFKSVMVENQDGLAVFRRYDYSDSLTYLDPPYPMLSRTGGKAYGSEFDEAKHEELLEAIMAAKGKVLISSYPNVMYDSALANWTCVDIVTDSHCARKYNGAKLERTERLWMNYQVGEKKISLPSLPTGVLSSRR